MIFKLNSMKVWFNYMAQKKMKQKKTKTPLKQRVSNGVKSKALNFMKGLTHQVGAEIYTEMRTLRDKMNLSIDELLDDNKDVDEFYNKVTSYYNDYISKGVED